MKHEILPKYDKAVPRYTSYPTAPHFHDGIGATQYSDWLGRLDPTTKLSLYLHVPFCAEMCWYCGCHTKVTRKYKPVSNYAQALMMEIDLLADALPSRFAVSHIHWGGGTPTMLSPADMAAITDRLWSRFDKADAAEIAVEIDPRTADAAKIEMLARIGVNRASLGIQDFADHVQRAINRVQSFETTKAVVDELRAQGITRINFDLMYGLPLQTVADIENTVDLSVSLSPDRIALFGYAHVPWMKTHMRMIQDEDLPDAGQRLAQAEAAQARLKAKGYVQIGLDHFAHPDDEMAQKSASGKLNRNFQGYTTDEATALLGLGASAIGRTPLGYIQNLASTGEYEKCVSAGQLPVAKGVATDRDDQIRRSVIERLMCDLEVDLAAILAPYDLGNDYFKAELERLEELAADGIVEITGAHIRIQDEYRLLMRNVCAVFDRYFQEGLQRHSRSV